MLQSPSPWSVRARRWNAFPSDLNDVEKIGHLEQPLSMAGMPAGDDPVPGDIGWYAPSGDVVFNYGDFTATIELAE